MNIDVFLRQNPKHKLVFTKSEPAGFVFTDLGYEMASRLDGQVSPSVVATAAFESVVSRRTQDHPIYGKYLAITNIGILFEPELKLNVRLLLESFSHNTLLVVCSDGVIQNDTFHFDDSTEDYDIALSGLSYFVIE